MRFTLTKKIGLPFLIILVLMIFIGVASLIGHQRASESIRAMQHEATNQAALANLQSTVASALMAVNDYIITGNGKYRDDFDRYAKQLDERLGEFLLLAAQDEERDMLENIQAQVSNMNEVARKIVRLVNVRTNPQAASLMEQMDYQYGDQIYRQMSMMVDRAAERLTLASRAVEEDRRWGILLVVTSSTIGLAVGITVVLLTMRRISRPIIELVRIAQRIAARDFAVKSVAETKDEIGMLVLAFNAMAEEISRRYEELENFAYIVAHDLKSPLVGIQGMSEILYDDYKDKLTNESMELLQVIVSSAKRMNQLINDLLEFARAGKVEFAKDPVPMNNLLQEVQTELLFSLNKRNAKMSVQENLPAVLCDRVRFSQIWKNLIGNAIKYNDMPSPLIEIGCEPDGGSATMYKFYVKDNGIGIPDGERERIFMPFQRATRDPKYEGTGIGLAIVKRVIEFHGGRVWVESSPDKGTTFYFTVPKPKVV